MIIAAERVTTDPWPLALVALGGALGGAFIGALGAALSSGLSSRAAMKRETTAYRRETYARAIASSHQLLDSVKTMMGFLAGRTEPGRVRRILRPDEAREADESDRVMAAALQRLMTASDELELLAAMVEAVGSQDVARATRDVSSEAVEWIVVKQQADVAEHGVVKGATIEGTGVAMQAKHNALIAAVRRALR